MAKVLIIDITIRTSKFIIVMSMVLDLPLPKILLLEGIIM